MYKTILVPIDTANVERAEVMIDAAKKNLSETTQVVFLSVIDAVPSWATSFIPDGEVLKKPLEAAKETLAAIAKEHDIEADIKVRTGHSYNTILEVADHISADLIVIASHNPGYGDYFLGSTAAKVVRHAKCSVFILR